MTERNRIRKDFLVLVSLWFLLSFTYFFSVVRGYRIYPRFFLLVEPVPFIMFGLIMERITRTRRLLSPRTRQATLVLVTGLLIATNLSAIAAVFDRLRNGIRMPDRPETEDIFPNTDRITLSQQEHVADYIASVAHENGYPVYLSSISDFEPALWYHLERLGITYYGEPHDDPLYAEGNYFFVMPTGKSPKAGVRLIPVDTREFGSLTVTRFIPDPSSVTDRRQPDDRRETTDETRHISEVPTWNKL